MYLSFMLSFGTEKYNMMIYNFREDLKLDNNNLFPNKLWQYHEHLKIYMFDDANLRLTL